MRLACLFVLVSTLAGQADAIPAFARKFNVKCTTCHTAYPYLNQTGRRFKEAGYRFSDEDGQYPEELQNRQKISDSLVLEKVLPLAVRTQSIPADLMPKNLTTASGVQYQMTPISDVNFLAIGNMFQYGSFMISAEAQGPDITNVLTSNAVNFGFSARVAAHPSTYFNLVGGYSPLFGIDPYPSLQSVDDPITIQAPLVLGMTFKNGADFSSPSPFISIYGRTGRLYYSAALTDASNNIAGLNPRVGQARLALDVTDTLEVGAFGLGGIVRVPSAADSNIWLAGIDTNLSTQEYVLSAIGRVTSGEDAAVTGSDMNFGASAQFLYIVPLHNEPHLLPLARVEWIQSGGGANNQVTGLVGLSAFVRQNIRVGANASMDLLPVDLNARQWRGTLFADLVF